jgi:hypothetical protein
MKIHQEIMPEIVHLFDKTVGCVMAFEAEFEWGESASGQMKEALLVFCSTGETGDGCVEVSPRMKDLAYMGFRPVALVRANSRDVSQFAIYALPDLPGWIMHAISKESENLVQDAIAVLDLRSDETGPISDKDSDVGRIERG